MVGDDPVADKLQDEDEEPSVKGEHPDLAPELLHLCDFLKMTEAESYICVEVLIFAGDI